MKYLYEGQRVYIEASHRKQDDRFYRSLHGRTGRILVVDYDEIYVTLDYPCHVFDLTLGQYVETTGIWVEKDTIRPLKQYWDVHILGEHEDFL